VVHDEILPLNDFHGRVFAENYTKLVSKTNYLSLKSLKYITVTTYVLKHWKFV
jgi:hypothetical protein